MRRNLRILFGTIVFTLIFNNIFSTGTNHWETIIKSTDTWKYLVPSSEPGTNWMYTSFSDASWSSGIGGYGFGDNDDNTILSNGILSCYIRKTFEVSDTSKIEQLLLLADYDDAFVAWINGVEVGRGGGLTDAIPAYNQTPTFDHEAVMYNGGYPESHLVSKNSLKNILVNGTNVLCIQIHNYASTSSDFSSNFFLMAGISDESVLYNANPSWFVAPVASGTSNLPLIRINTNGASIVDEPKIPATLSVFYQGVGKRNSMDDTPALQCRIGIETRGSSSQMFPKKSYGFETRTALDSNLNVSILGLPADNDWVLYAPYDDKTMIRDILAYTIGKKMGHYTPRWVLCELYVNDEYVGVYVLLEKIKQGTNRVNIARLKSSDNSGKALTGGYIFKIDKTTGSNNDGWTSAYHPVNHTDLNIYLLYHYPKPDSITTAQKSYIQSFVGQFEATLASTSFLNPTTGYERLINMPSFVDYFLVNEVSKNVDGYRISSYFHKDKEDRENKIVAGPLWDYNLAFGNADYYNGASTSDWFFNSDIGTDWSQVPFWWQRFFKDPDFCKLTSERYTDFRKNVLNIDTINAFIDSVANVLQEAQVRNYVKWPILGTYVWPNPFIGATYQQEIDYLKTWTENRLLWMDNNLPVLVILDDPKVDPVITDEMAVVYPNPFTTYLNIEIFPSKAHSAIIQVLDLSGKVLFSGQTSLNEAGKTYYAISENWNNLGKLPAGIYFLKIKEDNGKTFQTKIIKK